MSAQRSIVIGGGAFAGLALALALRQGLGARWSVHHRLFYLPSLGAAPWTLVEANDKRHARVKILQTVVGRIEGAVKKR